MKYLVVILIWFTLLPSVAQAGVVIGGTRLVYDGAKKESSLLVNNPDNIAYLIQSWVENDSASGDKAPFIITPPLFLLEAEQQNMLRVVRVGGNLPEDRESMYWLSIKSIASTPKKENTLQLAIKTRMKLIYRPASLSKGKPEEVTDQLTWKHEGQQIQVTNPTSYYMNFNTVIVNGKEVKDATYVAPKTTASFSLPKNTAVSGKVSWKILNDYGVEGKSHETRY